MDYVKERSKRGEALDIGEASLITVRRGMISYFRLLDPQSARSRMLWTSSRSFACLIHKVHVQE